MAEPKKLQRWLDMIAYLVGRHLPVSADELMRNVPAYAERWASDDHTVRETARRGFERDKDELRRFGIPIRTVPYSTPDYPEVLEGYVIERRDFYLPYLKLVKQARPGPHFSSRHRPDTIEIAEDDAPVALAALRRIGEVPGFPFVREARSAFRKLAFDLDPEAFRADAAVLFLEPPGAAELAQRLRVLSDALLARKRVTFRYHGIYRGEPTARAVATHGLLFQHGHWYLIGHDAARDDVRVFRVARMHDVEVNRGSPNTPDYEIPSDFCLDAYVGRQAWELGAGDEPPLEVRVLFRFPLTLWADRNQRGVVEARRSDGATVRRFDVQQPEPFLRWVLGLGSEAELIEPQSMREELHRLAAVVAGAHEGGAS